MLRIRLLLAFIPVTVLAQSQTPSIVAIQNNYSYTLPFSPNYGIAQGSIFIVLGSNLASTASGLQSTYPLPTKLNGVSIAVTVNNVVTHPYLYYVTPTQLAAILPSATPAGAGTIAVTNGIQTAMATIQVVQSSFGILTLNGAGTGPAAAFDASGNLLGLTNSANPGATITLWGSGAGPSAGDESVAQIPANLTNVPIEVDVGGVPATVTYHGRSIYPGLDQINLVVPPDVQPGCWTSIVVSSGASIGNFATIPVASNGQTCNDAVTGYSGAQLQSLYNQGAFNIGSIAIGTYTIPPRTVPRTPLGAETWNNASAAFTHYPSGTVFSESAIAPAAPAGVSAAAVSLGSCVVNPLGYINSLPPLPFSYLDAGPAITITSDTGTQTLTPVDNYYGVPTPGENLTAAFIPSAGDTFTFKNGTGGADVGAFSAQTAVPPSFVWNEMDTLTSVNRAQGVTVTWKNAAQNSFIQITGMSSATFGAISLATSFNCSVSASAGTFTVPPSVTLSLPPTATSAGIVSPAFLAVANYTYPQTFTAPGIAFGTIYGYVMNSTSDNSGFIYQ
jgi:uncharacterized protein (TIGR03437 family)